MGKESWGVFFEKFLKISFENKKSPPDSLNREEKVGEMLLNCYMKEVSSLFIFLHWTNVIY